MAPRIKGRMSSKSFAIERLRGGENFNTWERAGQSYRTISGYWTCTKSVVTEATDETIKDKHEKALSELYLMVEPQIYPYIEGVYQMKLAWAGTIGNHMALKEFQTLVFFSLVVFF